MLLAVLLAAESAANDGLAYPFLSISMYLTLEARKGIAVEKWFLVGWLCTLTFAVVAMFSTACRRGPVRRRPWSSYRPTIQFRHALQSETGLHRSRKLCRSGAPSLDGGKRAEQKSSTSRSPSPPWESPICSEVTTCWLPLPLVSCPPDRAHRSQCPCAGSAISWDGDFNDQTEDTIFSSVIDLVIRVARYARLC